MKKKKKPVHAIQFLKTLPPHTDMLLYIFKELFGFIRSYCPYQIWRIEYSCLCIFYWSRISASIFYVEKLRFRKSVKAKLLKSLALLSMCFIASPANFSERKLHVNSYGNNNSNSSYLLYVYSICGFVIGIL